MGTNILVVDPSLFVCSSVVRLCHLEIGDVEVLTARTLPWAAHCCRPRPPNLVIFDPKFLTTDDGDLFATFLKAARGARLLVFGDRFDALTLLRAGRIGVQGYVLKTVGATPFLGLAIRKVLSGQRAYQPAVQDAARGLMEDQSSFFRVLSDRELELLPDLGAGATNEELSSLYGRSPKTINNQRYSIMQKLNADSSVDLMRHALHLGFVFVDYRGAFRRASKWNSNLSAQLELF